MRVICSRVGCDNTASHKILWRNPSIHSEDRHKVWTACEEHSDFLLNFLQLRNFVIGVESFTGKTNLESS
ncbi:MAG: hypothetical protein NKF39_00565 [Tropheryma whipplei]|uniref:hypothetical protein n=1 Tax=Tropheryma whipplei TaxID=2039 RepID=UPI0002FAB75E|nr:hypothetical protein [Tropheryma whipplei]MCO8182408.1 hypothetical protein [Tropheryma whipplei]MCO8190178.1 hypothetical protein [Tropheryma whipplei]